MRWILLTFVMIAALVACTDTPPSQKNSSGEKTQSRSGDYTSVGGLDDIRRYGSLRLIAPRFDGADALPRDGVPVLDYHELAEAFAKALGLAVEWVFVDGRDELIPSLNEGKGDVIVTNLTVTDSRSEKVAFSRSITRVSEWVIASESSKIDAIEDLSKFIISVPEGTAYLDTLGNSELAEVQTVDSNLSAFDMLAGLAGGEYQATVLDSDLADALLPGFPLLEKKVVIGKHRPIAWAVRRDNPDLLQHLNQFLVSHHVRKASNNLEKNDWEEIKRSGRLRMLTLNNPASYFMWRGELMGFDYDLMEKFAQLNKLHLAVVIKDSIPELFEALKNGEGDVIAASMTETEQRKVDGVVFSEPYLYVDELLVGRSDMAPLQNVEDLANLTIGVNPETVFYRRLRELGEWELTTRPGETTESLIEAVTQGQFDLTVADSHLLAIEKHYHQNVKAVWTLHENSPVAWAMRTDQPELKKQLDTFIKKLYRGLFYNVTYNKYFENQSQIQRHQNQRIQRGGQLSPYDGIVKKVAKKYGMDWRLITSQMYQESKFNPDAKSFAGAQGLMQIMPRTAKELGYSQLHKPEKGIEAGVAYMHWLEDRFPGDLDFQERLFFVLASYNAGAGHVRDARKLARQLGLSPDKWFGNVEQAMLQLSKPRYYQHARFGYVRGLEPVTYVRQIHDRYLAYLNSGVE